MEDSLIVIAQHPAKLETATAASLWVTGGIGIAVAFNRYEIALALSVVMFLTLKFIPYVKDEADLDD